MLGEIELLKMRVISRVLKPMEGEAHPLWRFDKLTRVYRKRVEQFRYFQIIPFTSRQDWNTLDEGKDPVCNVKRKLDDLL